MLRRALRPARVSGRMADNVVDGIVEPPAARRRGAAAGAGHAPSTRRSSGAAPMRSRRGEVGLVVLAGGMATRMGGVVKALVEAVDGLTFLDIRLREMDAVERRYGAPPAAPADDLGAPPTGRSGRRSATASTIPRSGCSCRAWRCARRRRATSSATTPGTRPSTRRATATWSTRSATPACCARFVERRRPDADAGEPRQPRRDDRCGGHRLAPRARCRPDLRGGGGRRRPRRLAGALERPPGDPRGLPPAAGLRPVATAGVFNTEHVPRRRRRAADARRRLDLVPGREGASTAARRSSASGCSASSRATSRPGSCRCRAAGPDRASCPSRTSTSSPRAVPSCGTR